MLRTFIALDLQDAFARDALALIEELRGERLPRARWVTSSTLHVTVRFLGETAEELVEPVSELLARVGESRPQVIELPATSLLAFPNPRRAHVLALHLDDGGAIAEIAAATEREVTALGWAPELRAFRPHLTLARFREPADLRRLFAARPGPAGGGRLEALTFYRSELGREGAVHTPLARFVLR